MIVLPHGGPHGPRDMWGYNPKSSSSPNRGIAVLQVNFRGSGGFGKKFEKSGYRKWGGRIQEDIIDATKFVMDRGIAKEIEPASMARALVLFRSSSPSGRTRPAQCAVGLVGVLTWTCFTTMVMSAAQIRTELP